MIQVERNNNANHGRRENNEHLFNTSPRAEDLIRTHMECVI